MPGSPRWRPRPASRPSLPEVAHLLRPHLERYLSFQPYEQSAPLVPALTSHRRPSDHPEAGRHLRPGRRRRLTDRPRVVPVPSARALAGSGPSARSGVRCRIRRRRGHCAPRVCTRSYRRRRVPVPAVDRLDLNVPAGGVHGFLGPNGSGKTTTIRMVLGLIRADAGRIEVFGTEVPDRLPEVVDRVGAIVEQPKFFPGFSARRNLELLATGIGAPRQRVGAVLEEVGLAERAQDRYKTYSLGMKQRLAIAATLLKDPELLIFDEPTNGLDPAGIHAIRQTMRQLAPGQDGAGLQPHPGRGAAGRRHGVDHRPRSAARRGPGRVTSWPPAGGGISDPGAATRSSPGPAAGGDRLRQCTPNAGRRAAASTTAPDGTPVDAAGLNRLPGRSGRCTPPSSMREQADSLEQVFLHLTSGDRPRSARPTGDLRRGRDEARAAGRGAPPARPTPHPGRPARSAGAAHAVPAAGERDRSSLPRPATSPRPRAAYEEYLRDWEANHEQWETECVTSGGTAQECAIPRPDPSDWGLAATPVRPGGPGGRHRSARTSAG